MEKEEVKSVIFQLNLDKAPTLDGFLANFFQKFWDIVGNKLAMVVEE